MRNSSPKPSSRFSSSALIASYVLSRDVMPVPPVVMITWTSRSARWRSIVPRTSSGSSLTIVRPVTTWPAAVSRSAIVRPLVSCRIGPRVADRDDEAAHRLGRARLVLAPRSSPAIVARAHATIRGCVTGSHGRADGAREPVCSWSSLRVDRGVRLGSASGAHRRGPARSVHARSCRRALGRADAEEADAGREDRPAHRSIVRVELPEHRQRHIRHVDAARARVSRRRLSRLRCVAAGALRAAECQLRYGDSRPAVFRRVPHQPAAGDVVGAAAEHRRLRDRCRLPHLRRDLVSAADGDGRDSGRRGSPPGARTGANHRASNRARSACR